MKHKIRQNLTTLVRGLTLTLILLTYLPPNPTLAQDTPQPETVTIAGTIQSQVGCPGDWQPECEATFLTYDAENDVWKGAFALPAGDYEYKATLNKTWDENYGLNAASSGANIPLNVSEDMTVTFYYDHKTHWVTDNRNSVIATLIGDFQTALGCEANRDPTCLRTWLQDLDGNGSYTLVTTDIPAGDYAAWVAHDENINEIYGENGMINGYGIPFTVPEDSASEGGVELYFGYDPVTRKLIVSTEGAPRGNLDKAQAHWVARDTILWDVPDSLKYTYRLHYNVDGALKLGVGQIENGESIELTTGRAESPTLDKFPHLARYTALKIGREHFDNIPTMLKGHVAVSIWDENGKLLDATSLQIPGVLDHLYAYDGALGITYDKTTPTLNLWAPTARIVRVHLFDNASPLTQATLYDMTPDANTGVWRITGTPEWNDKFYLYEVTVYAPSTGRVETNLVTDPYALSLSLNSARSHIVNLDDTTLKPSGWDALDKPPLDAFTDIVLYELHIRDFSVNDSTVPEAYRGTYKAFTQRDANGMQHLRTLADAGLTHIHLLPAFDIASINEDKSTWTGPTFEELAELPPDSEEQQALLDPVRDQDGFNWGYDPFHYTVPEGSYSTNPDGATRIVEFREMVQALNQSGLRVVMDVVYNHTNASGQNAKSVLDKVVPGYYHRLDDDGLVTRSTCCENTATEHVMMEKLMVDSLVTWTTAYKVDGFRFDLMGHHMVSNMQNIRAALDALTLENDGVDGSKIYIYGEGWNFGEVADSQRGINATQFNIAGTGIGAFNDRLRDGVRGGSPFSGLQEQGFATGLYDVPNATENRSADVQRERLIKYMYWIRVGLAGSLQDYKMLNVAGNPATGRNIFYNGSPAGYTQSPQEAINYVSAHDNDTLFDAVQLKAPADVTIADRVRMHNLSVDLVMLAQGIPFFHAGSDMLRSKSMDRNSYNSGDWFNKLDFSYQTNNWGIGLPPSGENQTHWPVMRDLLSNPELTPSQDDIVNATKHFQEILLIRKSSKLFRLDTADDISERLQFLNTGPAQIPGLIVMALSDTGAVELDTDYEMLIVVFNATQTEQSFAVDALRNSSFSLHPVQAASYDPGVREASFDAASGAFSVPGHTTAVFVAESAPTLAPPASPTQVPQPTQTAAQPTASPTATPLASEPTPMPTPEPTPSPARGFTLQKLLWPILIGVVLITSIVIVLWSKGSD